MKQSKQRRRASAARLAELRAKRSDSEQLKLIASRPGNSAREKARLEARLKG